MTNYFQQQNIGGLDNFNSNNYGYLNTDDVQGLNQYIDSKLPVFFGDLVTSTSDISVNNSIPRFDGVSGSIIKESGIIISDTNDISNINSPYKTRFTLEIMVTKN